MSSSRDLIEDQAQCIWNTCELLRNQQSLDGETVTMSKGALVQCCEQIDDALNAIVGLVEQQNIARKGQNTPK